MTRRLIYRLALAFLVIVVLGSVMTAVANSNTFSAYHLGLLTSAMDANALKPAQCASLTLDSILVCPVLGGNCSGGGAVSNQLIIGSPFNDTISGGKGNDCILGGGGDDDLSGDQGSNVCIGGPNTGVGDTCRKCTAYQCEH